MRVYKAEIYCPHEGAVYAQAVFATREHAEAVAPWFLENREYFRKAIGVEFRVEAIEVGDSSQFDFAKAMFMSRPDFQPTEI